MEKLNEYWQASTRVAQYYNAMASVVFFKMLCCRLAYGFGPQDYVLFNFYSKPFSAAKTYLKKHELEAEQKKVNNEKARELVDNKLEFFLFCRQHQLPTPEILAVVAEQLASKYKKDIPLVKDEKALMSLIQRHGEGRYLLKPIAGSHGGGLLRFRLCGVSLLDDEDNPFDIAQVIEYITQGDSYILQPCLEPHKALAQVMPNGSLGTARIVTIRSAKHLQVFNPCLRIPLGKSINDNFVHGTSRNLAAGIELSTGFLLAPYGADTDGLDLVVQLNQHPESSLQLEGFEFPYWKEMLQTVNDAAHAFSDLTTIGWDVALTTNGPCLIEGNWRYDCALLQLAFDKGIKPELPKLLSKAKAN